MICLPTPAEIHAGNVENIRELTPEERDRVWASITAAVFGTAAADASAPDIAEA